MKPFYKKPLFIVLLFLLLLLGGGGSFLLNSLFNLDSHKDQILSQVEQSLNRRVLYGSGRFSFRLGPEFIFTDIAVKEKDGTSDFITARRLTIRLALEPLLRKRVVLRRLILDKPVISIVRNRDGRFNFSDIVDGINGKQGEVQLLVRRLAIRHGEVRFRDHAVSPQGFSAALTDLEFSTNRIVRGKKTFFRMSAKVPQRGKPGSIYLDGTAEIPAKERPLKETVFDTQVYLKDLDAAPCWPYYQQYVPFRQILGRLDLEGRFHGVPTRFSSKGKASIAALRFDYPQVFHALLAPQDLHFNYDMTLDPRDIDVKSLDLTVDGLNVKGGCAIRDIGSGDIRIIAHAKTSTFDLEKFHQYIPYGIIVDDVANYIEEHIKGGIYRLDDGRLDGRVSQIAHMELGTNYNVLFINGRVENGLLTYGPEHPTFNGIKGTLEMRGKDFILRQMSGNFGTSPFTMEGRITDYPLTTPCRYPFVMNIAPRQPELSWLLSQGKGEAPGLSGESLLRLSGAGTTDSYDLSGDWNLTQASYSYPGLIVKPAGRASSLSFKGNINSEEMKLISLQYNLAPMVLNIGASYRYGDSKRLALDIRSNQFQAKEVAPLIPKVRKYQPAGKFHGNFHGESAEAGRDPMHWSGEARLAAFSFLPREEMKPVGNIFATLSFSGERVTFPMLTATVGNSPIYAKGRLDGFHKPELALTFSSPSIDPADFGFKASSPDFRLTKVEGDVSLKDNDLDIKSFSTRINSSVLNLRGSITDMDNPSIDLDLESPYLEVEDVVQAGGLERGGKKGGRGSPISLNTTLKVESGKAHGIEFRKLSGNLIYENNILYLQPISFSALNGDVSGKVRIDFGSSGAPHYQVGYNLNDLSAEGFMKALGVKEEEITGTLRLEGELTAKGNNAEELKRTLLGASKVRIEEGKLRKFAVLSKVFSLLNLSQLLKFQLPDMVSGGMPYNRIAATLAIKDGVISSNDLYVSSDAINISAVGKADLVKDEMDVTIGVKPLQTVDKVISRIPIVGWVLTGSNRSLVTAYFEAKGKLGDPQVKAITVRSMAKGVFNIFKRVFELPAKLFTDTGEVIIGK